MEKEFLPVMSSNRLINQIILQEERAFTQRQFLQQYHFRPLQPGEKVLATDEERWEKNEQWQAVDRVFVNKPFDPNKMPDIRRKRR